MAIMNKYFRDPIHGHVVLPKKLVETVVDTPIFQRLRWIKQTSAAWEVYPALEGTRFQHSLGVAHLMGVAIDNLIENTCIYTKDTLKSGENWINQLLILLKIIKPWAQFAALLHDIGHLPFSHLSEEAIKEAHTLFDFKIEIEKDENETDLALHEIISTRIAYAYLDDEDTYQALRETVQVEETDGDTIFHQLLTHIRNHEENIRWMISKTVLFRNTDRFSIPEEFNTEAINRLLNDINHIVRNLISGPCDVDRADYILRDAYISGVERSIFNLDRYLAMMVLTENPNEEENRVRISFLEKGYTLVESFHLARLHLYSEVYTHKIALVYNTILRRLITYLFVENKIEIPKMKQSDKLIDYEKQFLPLNDTLVLQKIIKLYLSGDDESSIKALVESFLTRRHHDIQKHEKSDIPIHVIHAEKGFGDSQKGEHCKLVKTDSEIETDLRNNWGVMLSVTTYPVLKERERDNVHFWDRKSGVVKGIDAIGRLFIHLHNYQSYGMVIISTKEETKKAKKILRRINTLIG
ncbi:MAG: HD domain-containing protein [Candidatus Lokiarchaeota archaeon]|nr:HD domain-containing protein [Candidatus Lokiarchaeota archaeon]